MSDKLAPQPETFFEENRTRFNAETTAVNMQQISSKCDHHIKRRNPSEVQCTRCDAGWIDSGRFVIKDGKIDSII